MGHYTYAVAEQMKVRIYSVRASLDGGQSFNTYSSAGAFIKATGLNLHAQIRARHIAENGGPNMRLGDSTPPLRITLDGHECVITFTRSR